MVSSAVQRGAVSNEVTQMMLLWLLLHINLILCVTA
jgi:hypothetical protein